MQRFFFVLFPIDFLGELSVFNVNSVDHFEYQQLRNFSNYFQLMPCRSHSTKNQITEWMFCLHFRLISQRQRTRIKLNWVREFYIGESQSKPFNCSCFAIVESRVTLFLKKLNHICHPYISMVFSTQVSRNFPAVFPVGKLCFLFIFSFCNIFEVLF